MTQELSPNIQDYLKRIYEITSSGGKASTSQLAETLGISAASVTNMLQKLSKTMPPYVTYQKHKGAKLTEAGRLAALKILRRHRLIEHYLVQKLGYAWDEVHQEAEILEHAMSSLLESRIDAALGHPNVDPHGDPIPDADLVVHEVEHISLSSLAVGKRAIVTRVPHEDPQVLRYLGNCGLHPSAQIELLARTPYDQTIGIRVIESVEEVVIGPSLGGQVDLAEVK